MNIVNTLLDSISTCVSRSFMSGGRDSDSLDSRSTRGKEQESELPAVKRFTRFYLGTVRTHVDNRVSFVDPFGNLGDSIVELVEHGSCRLSRMMKLYRSTGSTEIGKAVLCSHFYCSQESGVIPVADRTTNTTWIQTLFIFHWNADQLKRSGRPQEPKSDPIASVGCATHDAKHKTTYALGNETRFDSCLKNLPDWTRWHRLSRGIVISWSRVISFQLGLLIGKECGWPMATLRKDSMAWMSQTVHQCEQVWRWHSRKRVSSLIALRKCDEFIYSLSSLYSLL